MNHQIFWGKPEKSLLTKRQMRRPQNVHNQHNSIFCWGIKGTMLLGIVKANNLILDMQFDFPIHNEAAVLSCWNLIQYTSVTSSRKLKYRELPACRREIEGHSWQDQPIQCVWTTTIETAWTHPRFVIHTTHLPWYLDLTDWIMPFWYWVFVSKVSLSLGKLDKSSRPTSS